MADFQKVLGKFRNVFRRRLLIQTLDGVADNKEVIETDYCKNAEDVIMEEEQNNYGVFDDMDEFKNCVDLSHRLYKALHAAKVDKLQCEILIPSNILRKISQDVLRMAQREPYGWRGCILHLALEERNQQRIDLTSVVLDPNTVATFELRITLKEEMKFHLRKILPNLSQLRNGCSRWGTLVLSPGFVIAKRKLYKHDSKWETQEEPH